MDDQLAGRGRVIREGTQTRATLTVIFAVPPDPKTPGFDCRETEPDGLPKRGSVNVGDTVLVADTAVGEVEPLAGHVSVGVRSVVGSEPRKIDSGREMGRAEQKQSGRLRVRPHAGERKNNEIMRTRPEQKSALPCPRHSSWSRP